MAEYRMIDPVRNEAQLLEYRKACELTDRLCGLLAQSIREGMSELMLLDAFIAHVEAIKRGVEDEMRDTVKTHFVIIESGERTAMLHGRATDRIIRRGDFVTLDFGLAYGHAASDMTRTFVVGEPDAEQKRIYETVLSAINECERTFRPGITGEEADAVARKVIEDAGYGDKFIHGLGHGFGDADDIYVSDGIGLAQGCDIKLAENMVFTIEPGIYIEGFGGVRIEDTVIMHEDGVEPLFNYTKELIII